jgi:hypothetical protein
LYALNSEYVFPLSVATLRSPSTVSILISM